MGRPCCRAAGVASPGARRKLRSKSDTVRTGNMEVPVCAALSAAHPEVRWIICCDAFRTSDLRQPESRISMQKRQLRQRCHSSLAQTLPPEEAPVDRPFWGVDDPSMPLPFDLADIINRVESLLWRM